MAKITDLSVKTLAKVVYQLRREHVLTETFDIYRDQRTNTKEKLLAYMLANASNEAIISAMTAVEASDNGKGNEQAAQAPKRYSGILNYQDINGTPCEIIFESDLQADITESVAKFFHQNPTHLSQGLTITDRERPLETIKTAFSSEKSKLAESKSMAKQISGDDAQAKLAALQALLTPAIDGRKVIAILDNRVQNYVDNILDATNSRLAEYDAKLEAFAAPTIVHFMPEAATTAIDMGVQHKVFPKLLKACQARMRDGNKLNIWLKGPAGSGKTTAAKKVAEALKLSFQFNGAISTEYELMGFRDAGGTYHTTAFREIFENGGVYLFDEVDSSLPKAVLAFNAALANGECRFPDKMVNRHKDCVIIAGANTAGNGATSDYVGRMKQDLAFLNRFVMLDWPLDEALEKALASNKPWCEKVQEYRKNSDKRGIKNHIISPRATFYGEALLAAGLDEQTVERMTLQGALTDDTFKQLRNEYKGF